jgi:hypothetical protein
MSRRELASANKNPPRGIGTFFNRCKNWSSISVAPSKRKPSPRKLEPHEVIAKLKARVARIHEGEEE